jgi:hypothetical protein
MMKKFNIRRLFALSVAFALLPLFVMAQTEGGGTSGTGESKGVDARMERQKAKRDWKKNRKQEMSDAKAKKEYNKRYNTKKTRKRMKKNEKKANKNNEHRRDFFLVRWWRKIFH